MTVTSPNTSAAVMDTTALRPQAFPAAGALDRAPPAQVAQFMSYLPTQDAPRPAPQARAAQPALPPAPNVLPNQVRTVPGGSVPAGTDARVAQAAGNPSPLKPDGFFYGVSTGSAVPRNWSIGAYAVTPDGNPLHSSSLYVTKGASFFPKGVGNVNIYNFKTKNFETGIGFSFPFEFAGVPAVGYVNARTNVPKNFTGLVSGNAGFVVSVNTLAAKGLQAAGIALANPAAGIGTEGASEVAGGSTFAAGIALEQVGKFANLQAGIGYSVQLRYKEGKLDGIYYKGKQIVDLGQFGRDALAGIHRYKPDVGPNLGDKATANHSNTVQLVFGTSPWDLARTSKGLNNGTSAVAIANQWSSVVQGAGARYSLLLPPDIRTIVAVGPRSNAEAAKAINAILAVASPSEAGSITKALANRYDIDLGVPAVKFSNNLKNSLLQRPADYDFVRGAFQGAFRDPSDIMKQQAAARSHAPVSGKPVPAPAGTQAA